VPGGRRSPPNCARRVPRFVGGGVVTSEDRSTPGVRELRRRADRVGHVREFMATAWPPPHGMDEYMASVMAYPGKLVDRWMRGELAFEEGEALMRQWMADLVAMEPDEEEDAR